MKKAIALLTALLIIASLFSGCSGNTAADNTSGTADTSASTSGTAAPVSDMKGMGNTALNSLNRGYAVLRDGVLCYTDRQNGGNIYKAAANFSGAKLLLEGNYLDLNISGGRLFFTDFSGVYSMNLDGTDKQTLVDGKVAESLLAVDEWLYYTVSDGDGVSVWRMKGNGDNAAQIVKKIYGNLIIDGGYLYYLVDGGSGLNIYRSALDGTGSAKISEAQVDAFIVHKGAILYLDSTEITGVYTMTVDGKSPKKLMDEYFTFENVSGDKVLYVMTARTKDHTKALYEMGADGTNQKKLSEGEYLSVNVVGDWLVFFTNDAQYRMSKIGLDGKGQAFIARNAS